MGSCSCPDGEDEELVFLERSVVSIWRFHCRRARIDGGLQLFPTNIFSQAVVFASATNACWVVP
jgi:hypothetical protein